ncbi:MAG: deoxynucleoside kinase [Bacteroidetes bacterium]|nr:deoxynucleoside kinase [Rhodothermia bacterium]MCS7155902.1 deoxynucleoside kinase [Bacteroidota bacterium]MCX7905997.1 deoxynucleoside kinase [Bacteroidota bacterium]MDW8138125.1 deoxynucleoside kinase [Bacteroidota bacterium]MDW8285809.1 deoxynucleoside kinase [Bacteroidota bacterium]
MCARKAKPAGLFIGVAGNIGVGKSSLTEILSRHFGWRAHFEVVDHNPYLPDFYSDMRRWSFHLQIFFLSNRFRHHREIAQGLDAAVVDRTIYEDAEIFARNLFEMGLMSERDYWSYRQLYRTMIEFLRPPDLLIYLRASVGTLVDQIRRRGRPYEANISIEYLDRLNRLYEEWIGGYKLGPKLVLDTDELDFVHNLEHRHQILQTIERHLFGLFPIKEVPRRS